MTHLTTIEEHIIKLLAEFTDEAHKISLSDNGPWTKAIKKKLYELGQKFEYETCASGTENCEPEWLYDVVWYKEAEASGDIGLSEVGLVVESEWLLDFREIKHDFEKLLLANAPYRLMICQAADNKDKLKSYFPTAVKRYKAGDKGARFIIAILDYYGEFFEFMHIIGETAREIDEKEIQQIMIFATGEN